MIDPGDLHEALISRGQVRGHAQIDLIHTKFNCLERHHATTECFHSGGIGGDKSFEIAARYLAKWEGEDNIRAWLVEMQGIFPTVATEALRRFNSVFREE